MAALGGIKNGIIFIVEKIENKFYELFLFLLKQKKYEFHQYSYLLSPKQYMKIKIDQIKLTKIFSKSAIHYKDKAKIKNIRFNGWSLEKSIENMLPAKYLKIDRYYRKDLYTIQKKNRFGFIATTKIDNGYNSNIKIIIDQIRIRNKSYRVEDSETGKYLYIDNIKLSLTSKNISSGRRIKSVNRYILFNPERYLLSKKVIANICHFVHSIMIQPVEEKLNELKIGDVNILSILDLEKFVFLYFDVTSDSVNCPLCKYRLKIYHKEIKIPEIGTNGKVHQQSENITISKGGILFNSMGFIKNDIKNIDFRSFVSGWWDIAYFSPKSNSIWIRLEDINTINFDEAIIFVGRNCKNWFHFVTEILIHITELKQINEDIPIIIPKELETILKVDLQIMTGRRVILFDESTNFHIQKAHYFYSPNYVKDEPLNDKCRVEFKIDGESIAEFRSYLSKFQNNNYFSKKLYVSRGHNVNRELINSTSVKSYLEKLGFAIFQPEKYTFLQQVEIFNESESAIFEPGSGAVNMVFMKSSAEILYFTPFSGQNFEVFSKLAQLMNQEMTVIIGDKDFKDFSENVLFRVNKKFKVNLNLLRNYFNNS